MMNSLRDQIKSLQAQGGNSDVNKLRREHVSIIGVNVVSTKSLTLGLRLIVQAEGLRRKFNQTLNDYQQAEKQHRDKQKERMARQFGIGMAYI